MNYRNSLLFVLCSLIWGTTWFVIKFQIDSTSAIVGVFYRFAIAAVLMMVINLIFIKKNLRYSITDHKYFMLHGLFNFCLNYILTYVSEKYVSSGLIALTFTMLIYFNMLGLHFFYKQSVSKNVFIGALLGIMGIFLLFWGEIVNFNPQSQTLWGITVGIIATFFASLGNMVAYRNHRHKIPVMTFNAFGMMYGALFSLGAGVLLQENFLLPTTSSFLLSLTYLSLFGTVVAFWAYQTLVGEIGADKAAYTSIISPMIAVVVSSFYEDIQMALPFAAGIGLCIAGNIFALKKEN